MSVLNIGANAYVDNSIINYAEHSHTPYSNTSLNRSDEIRIPILSQDIYTLPSESYLIIYGKVLDNHEEASTTIKFINNGILYLFDEIRMEIAGTVIDRVKNPGITSTLKGFVSFTHREAVRYENAGWCLNSSDNSTGEIIDKDGNFNVCIPLSTILGFCEDFKKIIINVRQELILLRSSNDPNCVITSKANEQPKIIIDKIYWKMPHIQVPDAQKLNLLNYLEKGANLQISYRCWDLYNYPVLQETSKHTWNIKASSQMDKPRYVIVGFQTNRHNKLDKNNSIFDHCNLTNIKLYLNLNIYPYDNLNLNFDKKHTSILYEMYVKFQQSYYNRSYDPCLSLKQFFEIANLYVIDCSLQNDTLKSGTVDVRLEFETSKNIPPDTAAYCLILHDKIITYNALNNIVNVT